MRILEINKFNFAKGGADRHFLDVCDLLESQGHEVARFCMLHPDNEKSRWSEYFVSTVGYTAEYSIPQRLKGVSRMFYSFEASRKIKSLLDDFRPDVAHIHNIYHQLSPAILFEIKKRGIPIIMTVHDYKLINPNHALMISGKPYGRCRNGKYYQCFFDRCVKNSYAKSLLAACEMYWHQWLGTYRKNIDLCVAPSRYVKKVLVDWGMENDKIAVVAHFADRIAPAAENIGKVSPRADEKYVLYAGRISRAKGVDTLIDIVGRIEGLKLYLAGKCEDGFEIPKSPEVKYLGFLQKEEAAGFMRVAQAVVSGSKLPETFGLVAMEALSQGAPFVGFDTGAYGEIVRQGIDGILCRDKQELEDILRKISRDEIVFDRNSIACQARERFDSAIYYDKIIDIIGRSGR